MGQHSTIRYVNGSNVSFPIAATDVDVNGSWRKNPIPACGCDFGQFCVNNSRQGKEYLAYQPNATGFPRCPIGGTQFEPSWPEGYGFGGRDEPAPNKDNFFFVIEDEVRVPAGLAAGDYVLSFRWDCEQTPQVWSSCADVRVG